MPRKDELRIDCAKFRHVLLVDCGLTVAGAEAKTTIPHSVFHRMLGGKQGRQPWANVTIVNVNLAVTLIRQALKRKGKNTDFGIKDLQWNDSDAALTKSEPSFNVLLLDATAFHRAAMANRDLAVRVYGQALTPLDPAAPPPVARVQFLDALEEAFRMTTPVRRPDSVQTEVIGAPILVSGEEGVGKTWLVAQWWLKQNAETLFLYLPASRFRSVDVKPVDIVVDELCAMISRPRLRPPDEVAAWRSMIQSEAFEQSAQGRMIVVIDGINEAPDADWPTVLEVLWAYVQRIGARLMLTSRPGFWRRRERELADGPWQHLATVNLQGFSREEFEQACRLADQDPAAIPYDLVDRFSNPRVFRLAMTLLPTLRRHVDFGIDRLLYAYWGRRQDERSDLRRLDPDRDVFLLGLARHAEAFHERRLKAVLAGGNDLDFEDVAFSVDDVGDRFLGLNRYRPADATAAAIMLGEIREGRFFDDDPLAPGGAYVFRKGSLAFALGLYLVYTLMDYVREERSRLGFEALRERLAALLEPVLDFDQTADQVMAAVTAACLDPIVVPQVRIVLLEQFLELRNRSSHLKSVLAALALEAPETFCEVAQMMLGQMRAERIDSWLLASLRYMVGGSIGLNWIRSWIVSPTGREVSLLWFPQPPEAIDEVVAYQRQTLAAMVMAGQALEPFAEALCEWAGVASDPRTAVLHGSKPPLLFSQTPLAQVIRFNDSDPEALFAAALACELRLPATHLDAGRRAVASLMSLIASPEALAHASERDPETASFAYGAGDMPMPPWHDAANPCVEPALLAKDFNLVEKLSEVELLDPCTPDDAALLAIVARCDVDKFCELARAAFNGFVAKPIEEASSDPEHFQLDPMCPYGSRSKSLALLAETCTSALARGRSLNLGQAKSALRTITSGITRVARDAAEEREQVITTLLAATGEKSRRGLLRAFRETVGLRTKTRAPVWRPKLSAKIAVEVIQDALSDWETGSPAYRMSAGGFVSFLATFPIDSGATPVIERLVAMGLDSKPEAGGSYDDGFSEALVLATRIDAVAAATVMLDQGWSWNAAVTGGSDRQLSAMIVRSLAGHVPLEAYANRVCSADLPLAAETISDDELPMLVGLIENALATNPGTTISAPSPGGAARMIAVRTDWITNHLIWYTQTVARFIDGTQPTADEFAAALIAASPKAIDGEQVYIEALLRRCRISRSEASQRIFKPALAVAARSPTPADILDPLIFAITDDRILAALVRNAQELSSAALTMFDAHLAALCASQTTIRVAYGLTLQAFREHVDNEHRQGFLKAVADHAQKITQAHMHAHYWANQRLAKGDVGAEHLALSIMSAPFPGSFDRLALPAKSGSLETVFWHRLVEKADGWGYDTLFGQQCPPNWLFARMQDS